MIVLTFAYAVALVVLGIGGYLQTGAYDLAALIPVVFALPVGVCAVLAIRPRPGPRAMHLAGVIGLVAFLTTSPGLFSIGQMIAGVDIEKPENVISQAATAVLSLTYFALCFQSFIDAQRRKG